MLITVRGNILSFSFLFSFVWLGSGFFLFQSSKIETVCYLLQNLDKETQHGEGQVAVGVVQVLHHTLRPLERLLAEIEERNALRSQAIIYRTSSFNEAKKPAIHG